MAKHCSRAQRELFEEPPQGIKLDNIKRAKVVEQLQVLLMEAIAKLGDRQQTGDDEDHA